MNPRPLPPEAMLSWFRAEPAEPGRAEAGRAEPRAEPAETADPLARTDWSDLTASAELGPQLLPPGAGASNLHTLFGGSGAPAASIQALSFQRPVQPAAGTGGSHLAQPVSKPDPSPAQANGPAESSSSLTLFANLVQIFRSVDGSWQSAGQAGLALIGGPLPKAFQIVLYEPSSKRAFSATTVSSATSFSTPSANYITLTDNQQEDLQHFLQHVTIVRALEARGPSPSSEPVTQDVILGEGHAAQAGDIVGIQYTLSNLPATPRSSLPGSSQSPLDESTTYGDSSRPFKCTVGADHSPLSCVGTGALAGMRKGGMRYIIDGTFFLQVELVKMKRVKDREGPSQGPPQAEPVISAEAVVPACEESADDPSKPQDSASTAGATVVVAEDEAPSVNAEARTAAEAKANLVQRMARLAGANQGALAMQLNGMKTTSGPPTPSICAVEATALPPETSLPASTAELPRAAEIDRSAAASAHMATVLGGALPHVQDASPKEATLMAEAKLLQQAQQILLLQHQAMIHQTMGMSAGAFGVCGTGGLGVAGSQVDSVERLLAMAEACVAGQAEIKTVVEASAHKLDLLLGRQPTQVTVSGAAEHPVRVDELEHHSSAELRVEGCGWGGERLRKLHALNGQAVSEVCGSDAASLSESLGMLRSTNAGTETSSAAHEKGVDWEASKYEDLAEGKKGFVAAAEEWAASLERMAAAAEERAVEAERYLVCAKERVADAEQRAGSEEERAAEAERKMAAAVERAVEAERDAAAAEQRAMEAERKVAAAEEKMAAAEERAANAEQRAAEVEQESSKAQGNAIAKEEQAMQTEWNPPTEPPEEKWLQKQLADANSTIKALEQTNARLELENKEMQHTVSKERENANVPNTEVSKTLSKSTEPSPDEAQGAVMKALDEQRAKIIMDVKEMMTDVYFTVESHLDQMQLGVEEAKDLSELVPRRETLNVLRATIKRAALHMFSSPKSMEHATQENEGNTR